MTKKAALDKLVARGEPATVEDKAQFFELYKLMVSSSEALVGRRQGVNTFFLTINGLLVTAIGLFIRGGGSEELKAGGILVLVMAGIVLCVAWRSLIISFGQLNTGKFVIINAMERFLAASVFDAEWEALERGEDPKVYRSFTSREVYAPITFAVIYVVVAILSSLVVADLWSPGM